MKYISTRGCRRELCSAEAVIKGIADDGGLYVPARLPEIEDGFLESLVPLSYQDRAVKVLAHFLRDYSEDELRQCVQNAYNGEKFDTAAIAPLQSMDETTEVLELWHGPTSAFKDMALQLLPQLMSAALKKTRRTEEIVILVATSGDTGKAALEGFKDVDQTKILVFYPQAGVSRIQQMQMVTQAGGNVGVVAVNGNFDDAQGGVKQIFNDGAFNKAMEEKGYQLSSANSINWGRLAPQIVYYFSAYAELLGKGKINQGDRVNFVVPTGNFGNILAGYYAKKMGLPVNRLICASNANNVLTEFLTTGTYNKKRSFYKTNTPSMDILISSNLERLLYHVSGDAAKVKEWMDSLNQNGEYTIGKDYLDEIQKVFWADWTEDKKTSAQIKEVYEKYHYVMDTHTAVAWNAANAYRAATGDKTLNVIVSTASPYKFNESVLAALQANVPENADAFTLLNVLANINRVGVPQGLARLKDAEVLHTKKCAPGEMAEMVEMLISAQHKKV